MSALVERVVKNTMLLYMRMGVTVFISLYSTRLILNTLGVEDFGIYNLIGSSVAMLTFLNNAMTSATQRFISFAQGSKDIKNVKDIFNASIYLHVIISVLIIAILEISGYFLFNKIYNIPSDRVLAAKLVYQFMVFGISFSVLSVPFDALINSHENMKFVAILGFSESIFKLIVAIIVLYVQYDKLLVYAVLTTSTILLLFIIRVQYCKRNYKECKIDNKKLPKRDITNELIKFASWNLFAIAASMISLYGQGIVLNYYLGPKLNAAQGIAMQVNGQAGAFATVMLRALNPVIDKSEGAGERDLMINSMMLGSKFSFYLWMIICVPVLIELPTLFSLWLKDTPEFSIVFTRLFLIRNMIEQFCTTLNTSTAAVGNIKYLQIRNAIIAVTLLPLSSFLLKIGLPATSLYLVFITGSLLSLFNSIYSANMSYNLLISKYLNKVLYPSVVVFILSFIFTYIFSLIFDESIYGLFLISIISVIISFSLIYLFGTERNEKNIIDEIIKRNVFKKKIVSIMKTES